MQYSYKESMLRLALAQVFGDLKDGAIDEIIAASNWLSVPSGYTVFYQGEEANNMYFVVSGRLRSTLKDAQGQTSVVDEVSRGDTIGDLAVITRTERKVTVEALRDSTLVSIEFDDLLRLSEKYPYLLLKLTQKIIERLTKALEHKEAFESTISNIMIYPSHECIDTVRFTEQLKNALETYGTVEIVASEEAYSLFGQDVLSNKKAELLSWLESKEEHARFVIYIADLGLTPWSQQCLNQADRILLLNDFSQAQKPTEQETALYEDNEIKSNLVFIHGNRNHVPSATNEFLVKRKTSMHFHIVKDDMSDMARVGRHLNGSANGLVLAGGGARGFVHLGVIKALAENNIPIDMIGGTSIGAVIAGSYAMHRSVEQLYEDFHDNFVKTKPLNDYTLPLVSFFAGRKLDRMLDEYYQQRNIEDCWLNFYCVAGNISRSGVQVHTQGSLWRAVRSSLSLPGVVPPTVIDGQMMVDGAMVDNYPVEVMRNFGAGKIIGVDLVEPSKSQVEFSGFPNPWQVIKEKVTGKKHNEESAPGIITILLKSALLSSSQSSIRNASIADYHWTPKAWDYSLLNFQHMEAIAERGYEYALSEISKMSELELENLRN